MLLDATLLPQLAVANDVRPLFVDSFAGGGGASTGIEAAIGRAVDVAINHDPEAIAMHEANHPATRHFCQSIMAIDPLEATGGVPVALAWFSPDCKHHSKAKGGKPRDKNIRDLATVVPHWAERLSRATPNAVGAPRVIMLENVEEFRDWGPLDADGMPIKARKGEEFDLWVRHLRRLGYKVEHRELRACDYGAPTSRKRLYLIARRDGRRIVWPEPTHGKPGSPEVLAGTRLPWRTAAECIDWTIPCPSIFDRKRPLKEATNRRIAHGVMRYVVNAASPFIVPNNTNNVAKGIADPLPTVTTGNRNFVVDAGIVPLTHHGAERVYGSAAPFVTITGAHRGELARVTASIVPVTHSQGHNIPHSPATPLRTITTARDGELAGVTVTLAPHITKFRANAIGSDMADPMPTVTANGNPARPAGAQPLAFAQAVLAPVVVGCGGRRGQSGPVDVRGPYPTTTAKADACLVSALLTPFYGEKANGKVRACNAVDDPLRTQTADPTFGLVAATMVQTGYGERDGQAPRALNVHAPLGTIVAGGAKHGLVTAHLEKFSENSRGRPLGSPLDTVMAGAARHGLVTTFLSHFYTSNTNGGQGDPRQPVKTVTSEGQHHAVVAAHMEQANTGVVGHDMRKPLSTIVGKGCTQRLVETTMIDAGALPPDLMDRAVKVAAFLIKYYGNEDDGHGIDKPIGTVTTLDRFAVVTVTIDAITYVIVDIGMRMLTPRELANAQGFPPEYILDPIGPNGKPLSKSAQIRMIGNSVCPDMAEALVRANLPELCTDHQPAEAAEAAA